MIQYSNKRHKHPITLTKAHLLLLKMIGDLGFANINQIDMLWSICSHYPTTLTRSILREWCSYGGIMKKVNKSKKQTANSLLRTVYMLNKNGRCLLADQHLWTKDAIESPIISLNSHNEQAIEVIVQGLYAATFKYRTLGTMTNSMTLSNHHIIYSNPMFDGNIEVNTTLNGPDGAGPTNKNKPGTVDPAFTQYSQPVAEGWENGVSQPLKQATKTFAITLDKDQLESLRKMLLSRSTSSSEIVSLTNQLDKYLLVNGIEHGVSLKNYPYDIQSADSINHSKHNQYSYDNKHIKTFNENKKNDRPHNINIVNFNSISLLAAKLKLLSLTSHSSLTIYYSLIFALPIYLQIQFLTDLPTEQVRIMESGLFCRKAEDTDLSEYTAPQKLFDRELPVSHLVSSKNAPHDNYQSWLNDTANFSMITGNNNLLLSHLLIFLGNTEWLINQQIVTRDEHIFKQQDRGGLYWRLYPLEIPCDNLMGDAYSSFIRELNKLSVPQLSASPAVDRKNQETIKKDEKLLDHEEKTYDLGENVGGTYIRTPSSITQPQTKPFFHHSISAVKHLIATIKESQVDNSLKDESYQKTSETNLSNNKGMTEKKDKTAKRNPGESHTSNKKGQKNVNLEEFYGIRDVEDKPKQSLFFDDNLGTQPTNQSKINKDHEKKNNNSVMSRFLGSGINQNSHSFTNQRDNPVRLPLYGDKKKHKKTSYFQSNGVLAQKNHNIPAEKEQNQHNQKMRYSSPYEKAKSTDNKGFSDDIEYKNNLKKAETHVKTPVNTYYKMVTSPLFLRKLPGNITKIRQISSKFPNITSSSAEKYHKAWGEHPHFYLRKGKLKGQSVSGHLNGSTLTRNQQIKTNGQYRISPWAVRWPSTTCLEKIPLSNAQPSQNNHAEEETITFDSLFPDSFPVGGNLSQVLLKDKQFSQSTLTNAHLEVILRLTHYQQQQVLSYRSQIKYIDQQPQLLFNRSEPKRFAENFLGHSYKPIDLISNPTFSLEDFDFRSFNRQFANKFAQHDAMPFIADMMISFNRHHRRHELFIELDNRTETNDRQASKVRNYIEYALQNPDKEIEMIIAVTDGSLRTAKVKKFNNVGRKLANIANRIMQTYVTIDGRKIYLSNLYQRASNLQVRLTGVSEAYLDVAEFLLGSNYLFDYTKTLDDFCQYFNKHSEWQVNFVPSKMLKATLNNPDIFSSPLGMLNTPFVNNKGKELTRYLPLKCINQQEIWGHLHFFYPAANVSYDQPILFGHEHELNTIMQTYNLAYLAHSNDKYGYPFIVYPHRERHMTAITLSLYKHIVDWNDYYTFRQPVLLQPMWSLNNNYQLLCELRWLTVQYANTIYTHFKTLEHSSLQSLITHPHGSINFCLNQWMNRRLRKSSSLTKAAQEQNVAEFISQLQLGELPIALISQLLDRWPKGMYSIPQVLNLPYWNNELEITSHKIAENILYSNFLSDLNSVLPETRKHPKIR